jgi:hypothetical protein
VERLSGDSPIASRAIVALYSCISCSMNSAGAQLDGHESAVGSVGLGGAA